MKDFIFVSDFDGTLTKVDFYRILIDKYLYNSGEKIYIDWQSGRLKDIDALGIIYSSTGRDESELLQDILSIEIDPHFEKFVENVERSGGDFLILSAGTSYYIERFLEHKGITGIPIISNKGTYENRGIRLIVDKESPYYSENHGIDKGKYVTFLKEQYNKVYFAGDSKPDISPAVISDIAFARGKLKNLLDDINQTYIPFENLKEIENYLKSIGVIKNE